MFFYLLLIFFRSRFSLSGDSSHKTSRRAYKCCNCNRTFVQDCRCIGLQKHAVRTVRLDYQMARQMLRGVSNKNIARQFYVSEATVERVMHKQFNKLGLTRFFIRTSSTSYLHSPSTSTILPPCQHHTSTMSTSCGTSPRTPTSMLATPQTLQHGSKRTMQGMCPTLPSLLRGKFILP